MNVLVVVGARPNFVKAAPLVREMRRHRDVRPLLVHTGQHYDARMSDRLFEDLGLPAPDVNLGVGSGSHAAQTAEVMRRLEPVLEETRPDRVVVVGDVNSTLAAAITAAKLGIPLAHVEAGLRSFDPSMPEEINRRLTDTVADLLFVTEESGRTNLLREGTAPERIHLVGNVMIDALRSLEPRWSSSPILRELGLDDRRRYGMLTLHRPSNVDDPTTLERLLGAVREIARRLPILFPVHPRAEAALRRAAGPECLPPDGHGRVPREGLFCLPALGYLECIALMSRARLVLTDSGGVQEETTALGVPCLTLRTSTERPVTVTDGTNEIVGTSPARIVESAVRALEKPPERKDPVPLWDGRAAVRIVDILRRGVAAAGASSARTAAQGAA